MLEINLQGEYEKLQTSYGLNKSKEMKQNTQVYLIIGAMGHHALVGRSTSLSHSAMEELWLNGEDEWKRGGCGWLEAKRSQDIHGQHNSMEEKSCLRVTPHPPFIAFLRTFRVLSP